MMSGPTNIPAISSQVVSQQSAPSSSYNSMMQHHATPSSQFSHSYLPSMDDGMRSHHRSHHLGLHEDDFDDSDEPNIVREQDRLLPIANVARIMKMAVPSNAKIAKDAKETVQECFRSMPAGKKKDHKRRGILWAMESLGFDHYVQLLKIYLQKYKETLKLDKDGSPSLSSIQLLPGHQHQMHRPISLDDQGRLLGPTSLSLFHSGHPSRN
ncbi:hypothetical protein MDAP_002714 [Mitosporidium daphniae]